MSQSEPLRILHVVRAMNCGGTEALLMSLYRSINRSKLQFDFAVQTEEKAFYDDEILNLGGKIWRFPDFRPGSVLKFKKSWDDFLDEHPEYPIIHGHIGSSALVYLSCGKKHGRVAVAHSHNIYGRIYSMVELIFRFLAYPQRYIADEFFGCSDQAGVDRFGKKVATSHRFRILNNGIRSENYVYDPVCRKKIRQALGIDDSTYLIGHVGRFEYQKNHAFLLEFFQKVYEREPDSKLLLIGDGQLRPEMVRKAETLGLQDAVIFFGLTTRVYDYLQAMDCFVFPSHFEGLGIAAVEAQCAGLPCVLSDTIPKEVELTEDLTFLSPEEPATTWADTILKYKDHVRQDRSAQIKAAGYDIETSARMLTDFYFSLL